MIRKLTSALALLALVAMFGAAPRLASAATPVVGSNHVIFHDNYVANYLYGDIDCVNAFVALDDDGSAADLTDEVRQTEDADGVYALNEYTPCAWPGDHGWSFLGWSTEEPVWVDDAPTADALNVDYENGGGYDFAAGGIVGGINLYAVWAPPTITYNDPQGAAAEIECTLPDAQYELNGGFADLSAYDCDNSDWSGHQFNGWVDQNRLSYAEDGEYDFDNGNLNLSAVWINVPATVTYRDTAGSGCTTPRPQTVNDASWKALRTYTCTWLGHEFLGWSSDELLAGEVLEVGDDSFNPVSENAYENGQFGQGEMYDFSGYFDGACGGHGCAGFNPAKGDAGLYTGDNTLYAVWQLVEGTVHFQDDRGDCEVPADQTGSGVQALTSYSCEDGNLVFYAWTYRLTPGGTTHVVDNAGDFDFSLLDGRTITLNASYHLPETTVHFVDNTTDCVVPDDVAYSGVVTEALPAYSCDTDLHSSGWSLTEDGDVDYLDEGNFNFGSIDGTVNLYAVWDRVTVHFVDNFSNECTALDDVIGDWGDTEDLPAYGCSWDGHDFLGWSDSEEHGTSEADVDFEDEASFEYGYNGDIDVTLYAVWSSDVEAPTYLNLRSSDLPRISYSGSLRYRYSTELSVGYDGNFVGDEIEYSYEWYRCDRAISTTRARLFADSIPGIYGCTSVSTDDTYVISVADNRKYILLIVTAFNSGGEVSQMSKSTGRIVR